MVKLIAFIFPLAVDSFTVAAALGATGVAGTERWRISALFASFEAGMPLIGIALGGPIGQALGGTADFLSAALLVGLGVYLLLSSEDEEEGIAAITAAHGWGFIALGVSVSLDEFAVGFSFGALGVPILPAVILIAVQAVVASQIGFRVGHLLSAAVREGAERLVGVVLIIFGITIAVQQLT